MHGKTRAKLQRPKSNELFHTFHQTPHARDKKITSETQKKLEKLESFDPATQKQYSNLTQSEKQNCWNLSCTGTEHPARCGAENWSSCALECSERIRDQQRVLAGKQKQIAGW
jgi:hypothetical protein